MHRAGPPPSPPRRPSRWADLLRWPGTSRWAGAVTGVAAVAVLAGAMLTVRALADDHGSPAAGRPTASARPAVSLSPTPGPAAPTPTPSVAPSTARAARSPSAPPSRPASPPPAGASGGCTSPVYKTSDPNGGWQDGAYYVTQDMWNASNYSVQQTLDACSYRSWYVVANMNNDSEDGAVKTYPNVHEDFNEQAISSFSSITSTFAEHGPHVGIYEYAYDIWLNGVASNGSTEVMIWNDNFHQVPGGSVQGSVTFSGHRYQVWRDGSYVALVADANFTAGSVDLLAVFKWIISNGWIPSASTVGQIDYGVELVSTSGAPATFGVSNFSISAS
jgi:hypothetical protein